MEIVLLLAVLAAGYFGYRHYASSAKVAAVKAELATIEAHVKGAYSIAKADLAPEAKMAQDLALTIVAALKAKLGK
jgi:hypothetical protein